MFFGFCPGINEIALEGENESYFIAGKKIQSLCWELDRANTHRECMLWNKMPAVEHLELQPPEQLGGPGPELLVGCLLIPSKVRRVGGKE